MLIDFTFHIKWKSDNIVPNYFYHDLKYLPNFFLENMKLLYTYLSKQEQFYWKCGKKNWRAITYIELVVANSALNQGRKKADQKKYQNSNPRIHFPHWSFFSQYQTCLFLFCLISRLLQSWKITGQRMLIKGLIRGDGRHCSHVVFA